MGQIKCSFWSSRLAARRGTNDCCSEKLTATDPLEEDKRVAGSVMKTTKRIHGEERIEPVYAKLAEEIFLIKSTIYCMHTVP